MTMVEQAASVPKVDTCPRCWRCDKQLGVRLTRPWHIDCPRCRATNKRDALAPDESIT